MAKSVLKAVFAQNIRALRKIRGLSQEALAKKAKISKRYVLKVEAEQGSPTLDHLESIAKVLGVTPAELLEAPSSPSKGKAIRAAIQILQEIERTVD